MAHCPSIEPDYSSLIPTFGICVPENYSRNHFASVLQKYYSHDGVSLLGLRVALRERAQTWN